MRRHLLGLIAAALLVAGVVGLAMYGLQHAYTFYVSIALRCGLTLGAVWLAWPQLVSLSAKVSPIVLGLVGIAVLVVMIRPKALLVVAPLLGVLALLQFLGWLMKPLPPKKRR